MKAEKVQAIEYQCPSCGADLDFADGVFITTCKYCGARVERQLDRSAQEKVSAAQQLEKVRRYRENTEKLEGLKKRRKNAKDRVKLCSENALIKLTVLERFPFLIAIAALIPAAVVLFASEANAFSMVVIGLIAAVAIIVMLVHMHSAGTKRELAKEAQGRLDEAQRELVQAGDELEEFEKQFDIEEFPKGYRSAEALKQLTHIFETAQACTMGEGFKLCDEYFNQKKLEEMRSEQIARVAMLTQSLKSEQEVRLMPGRRTSMADILDNRRRATSDRVGELMMAIAKTVGNKDRK